ncbi:MAG TPA: hypothetical protein VGP93_14665 [Polyangiaceae bacterium]|jgi:quinol monooxygenase YgiN|nr:hypothetical protein [Polyangiaceae bacterium]
MPTMIVKHRVANFETWKTAFDSMNASRREHGWKGHAVLRDATDPNLVTILNDVSDAERAKAYGGSAALRSAMQRGGIQGPPEIYFLESVEEQKY